MIAKADIKKSIVARARIIRLAQSLYFIEKISNITSVEDNKLMHAPMIMIIFNASFILFLY